MTNEKRTAETIIKNFNTNNPFEIADYLNINIIFEDLGKIKGYYTKRGDMKLISINKWLNYQSQRFVCSHEIGHSLLHSSVNVLYFIENTIFSLDKIEKQANTFAVELLLSDNIIKQYEDYHTLEQIAVNEGVPIELIKYKYN